MRRRLRVQHGGDKEEGQKQGQRGTLGAGLIELDARMSAQCRRDIEAVQASLRTEQARLQEPFQAKKQNLKEQRAALKRKLKELEHEEEEALRDVKRRKIDWGNAVALKDYIEKLEARVGTWIAIPELELGGEESMSCMALDALSRGDTLAQLKTPDGSEADQKELQLVASLADSLEVKTGVIRCTLLSQLLPCKDHEDIEKHFHVHCVHMPKDSKDVDFDAYKCPQQHWLTEDADDLLEKYDSARYHDDSDDGDSEGVRVGELLCIPVLMCRLKPAH